jgi:hypothetical protein
MEPTKPPLLVTVEIIPKRKYFIKGYYWTIYDENDKVQWNGSKGIYGWMPTSKSAFWIVKFIIRNIYFRGANRENSGS